jgi:heterotetrameric sarcosine oxidase gamma subunit
MSFEFLAVDAARPEGGRTPLARSPMERAARAAGARFEARDGWNVAVASSEAGGCAWTDLSHLGKLELHGSRGLELGTATRDGETWWCPVTRDRTLVICPSGETAALRRRLEETAYVVDVTTAYAALAISGPLAREVFARFCALDLRPAVMPVGAFRPGSVARTPGMVLRQAEDRYLMLFGAALGEYMWTVVADAAEGAGA